MTWCRSTRRGPKARRHQERTRPVRGENRAHTGGAIVVLTVSGRHRYRDAIKKAPHDYHARLFNFRTQGGKWRLRVNEQAEASLSSSWHPPEYPCSRIRAAPLPDAASARPRFACALLAAAGRHEPVFNPKPRQRFRAARHKDPWLKSVPNFSHVPGAAHHGHV